MARELPPGYTLHVGFPPVETYINLRSSAGLSAHTSVQAAAAFKGSWYGCYISFSPSSNPPSAAQEPPQNDKTAPISDDEGEIVAMGRIVGDGGWYFVIADMAVLPTHQRKGLGDYILKSLISKIESTPPMSTAIKEGGPKPYVNLLADPPGRKLYERNGFVYTDPHSLGMALKWN